MEAVGVATDGKLRNITSCTEKRKTQEKDAHHRKRGQDEKLKAKVKSELNAVGVKMLQRMLIRCIPAALLL